jgi:hypothetical protein
MKENPPPSHQTFDNLGEKAKDPNNPTQQRAKEFIKANNYQHDAEYWEAVRLEAEKFWDDRYNSEAKDY